MPRLNKDKHKLVLLQCHRLIAQRLSFPGWLDNQAITTTDSGRYSSKLKWVEVTDAEVLACQAINQCVTILL